MLENLEFYHLELMVKNVVMSSPADKVNIKKGDILISLGGKKLHHFEELRQTLQKLPDNQEIIVEFLSGGSVIKKSLLPEVKLIDKKKMKLIGIESSIEYVQPKLVEVKAENFGQALLQAFNRTYDGILKTFSGYKKLVTREVSLNNVGGPLAIGKVASDSFNISLSMFFRLMAIISINLGVINLFPIPVLDGGHIVFLLFELVNGGPLSKRKLEIAQRFGISILFFLIFVALFNDITKLF
jgi:regulator of sigma E protease